MAAIAVDRLGPDSPGPDGRTLRALRRVIGGALVVWLGILGLTAATTVILPQLSDVETFTIRGGSMEPAIPLGAIVAVVPADDVQTGDVITYRAPNDTVVTHRVLGVVALDGTPHLLTKGDANDDPDPAPVSPDAVIGRVQLVVPFAGYLAWMMSIPLGLVGLGSSAGSLLLLLWLLEDVESERAERKRLLLGKI